MPIIGFEFTKTSIERTKPIIKAEKIDTLMKVTDLKEEEVAGTKFLRFFFEFEVIYGESGKATLDGNVAYTDSLEKLKKVIEDYKATKDVSQEARVLIYNAIFYKCNVKLLQLSEAVGLPPHFQIPSVVLKKN